MELSKKSFFGAAVGTTIEYYDYALMSIFLPVLSPLFFPADTIYQSLVKGYFILLIGMLVRPLGGIAFGYLGDTLGRRKALLASMYGIAIATLAIGLMPGFAVWGVWSSILIIIAKSIQMFCFGGEFNGAGIYVVEHAQNRGESLASSWLAAMMLAGSLIASLLGILFTAKFMPEWSWRIAFVLGSFIGIFGIFYRKDLAESPAFTAADLKIQNFRNMVKQYGTELLAGIFIGGYATLLYTTVLIFINPVRMAKGHINSHQLMIQQTLLLLIAVTALIISGKLADKYSPKKIMQWSSLILIVFAYPLLTLIDAGHALFFSMAVLIILNEMVLAPANAYLKNLFAPSYRYRASSLSFCLGLALIGGMTPIIENYLYQITGHFQTIAIWPISIALAMYLTLFWVHKKQKSSSIEAMVTYGKLL